MNDRPNYQDRLRSILQPDRHHADASALGVDAGDLEGAPGSPFGYQRGIDDKAEALEFRFRDGTSCWFPYGWLGPWRHDPSEGLLLKFSGDIVYLVLIRGCNLDKPVKDGGANLTTGGLQRHRILWIREMSKADIESVGEKGPTMDSIEVAELETQAEVKEWLKKKAPSFLK